MSENLPIMQSNESDPTLDKLSGNNLDWAQINRDRYGVGITENSPEAQTLIDQQAKGDHYNEGRIDPFDSDAMANQFEVAQSFDEIRDNYLSRLDKLIDDGVLPGHLKDRWHTIIDSKVGIRTNLDPTKPAINVNTLSNGKETNNILVKPDILSEPDNKFIFEHEISHELEGNDLGTENERGATGLTRLFPEKSYLGTLIDEGMDNAVTELITGEKIDYSLREQENSQFYHISHDFLGFLCNKGQKPIDFSYFINAHTKNGLDGEKAINELRNQIAEAFPTENGINPLDNLNSLNEAQTIYWLAEYTGHTETAEKIKKNLVA